MIDLVFLKPFFSKGRHCPFFKAHFKALEHAHVVPLWRRCHFLMANRFKQIITNHMELRGVVFKLRMTPTV